MYPTLKNWFGLPLPQENKKRFDSSELQCWTDEARKQLKPKLVHEILRDEYAVGAEEGFKGTIVGTLARRNEDRLRLLGIQLKSKGEELLRNLNVNYEIEGTAPPKLIENTDVAFAKITLRLAGDPKLAVPLILLRNNKAKEPAGVVVGIAQEGKAGFLKHRAETIAELLKRDIVVCFPDLRGTGETANDGRGRQSGATSYSATLLMHGQTTPGVQLQELVMVMDYARRQHAPAVALWGDSFAEPNDPKTPFAVPYDNNIKLPRQAEPMGATLALLGGNYGWAAVYARGGLVHPKSILDSPFMYVPHDAVIPGVLPRNLVQVRVAPTRLESLVDGLNRRVDQATLEKTFDKTAIVRAEPSREAEVAAWLATHLKR
jgi:hypothetical protein